MSSRHSSSSSRSSGMLEEYQMALNDRADRSLQFCMDEEPIEPGLVKRKSMNQTRESALEGKGIEQKNRWTPTTPSDLEYLKFLNFNTSARRAQPEFDFEMSEKKQNTSSSSSDNEGFKTKRSRSKEKKRNNTKHEKVTGEDLRRLFGEGVQQLNRRVPIFEIYNTINYQEPRDASKVENEISESNSMKNASSIMKVLGQPVIRCSCNKTKCLKMYCTCYSSGMPCGSYCECKDCKNNEELYQDTANESMISIPKQVISCSCKMTYCEKSYCTCSRNQQGCSHLCSCYSCKNYFGTRPKK